MNKNLIACVVASMLLVSEVSYAAFGEDKSIVQKSQNKISIKNKSTVDKNKDKQTQQKYKLHYYPKSGLSENYPTKDRRK